MKNLYTLYCLLLFALSGTAQTKENCRDQVYLNDGSILLGKITDYHIGGDLTMTSWSGGKIQLPAGNVKKIKQICRDEKTKADPLFKRPYTFQETGWYHASRFEILWGNQDFGLGLQHSSGLKLNRSLGVGIGVGIEHLGNLEEDVTTYPLFLEVRGYLWPKNVTPFYALGLGWAFVGKENDFSNISSQDWKGGWMAQWQIGYRLGNHFTMHGGLRFQRKTRTWSNWWNTVENKDKILQKRLEIGIGILL
ncbi:MAG: hypothetical protein ACKVT2_23050 [Saprospiraceae bacterium]